MAVRKASVCKALLPCFDSRQHGADSAAATSERVPEQGGGVGWGETFERGSLDDSAAAAGARLTTVRTWQRGGRRNKLQN